MFGRELCVALMPFWNTFRASVFRIVEKYFYFRIRSATTVVHLYSDLLGRPAKLMKGTDLNE